MRDKYGPSVNPLLHVYTLAHFVFVIVQSDLLARAFAVSNNSIVVLEAQLLCNQIDVIYSLTQGCLAFFGLYIVDQFGRSLWFDKEAIS